MFNLTPVVKNLIIINVVVLFIQSLINIDLNYWGGLRHIDSDMFYPFQFVTYMFLHSGFGHLFSNMLGLLVFGPTLERFWGSQRFLLFWMITGLGAGLLYFGVHYYEINQLFEAATAYVQNPNPTAFSEFLREFNPSVRAQYYEAIEVFHNNPEDVGNIEWSKTVVMDCYKISINHPNAYMVGASGAVFGVLMAYGLLFPNTMLMLLIPPIPIKAKYLVGFYALYEIYAGLEKNPGDNVAHYAHLGGMLIAFLLIKYWERNSNRFY